MPDYVIAEVFPEQLKSSPSQPKSRNEMDSAFNSLRKSISDIGCQYPPLVVRDQQGDGFTIVDGHRRVGVMRKLGWPKIPVLVGRGDGNELFAAVSGTTKPLNAIQWCEVFLNGGALPPTPTKTCITKLNELMGRDFLQKLVEAKISPNIWSLSKRALQYMGLNESKRQDVIKWLFETRGTRSVSSWIQNGDSVKELMGFFESMQIPKAC